MGGDTVIVTEFMQGLELYRFVQEILFEVVGKLHGQKCAQALGRSGLHRVHKIIPISDLGELIRAAEQRLATKFRPLMQTVLTQGLSLEKPVWVLHQPYLRMLVPHDATSNHHQYLEEFRKSYADGRLTTLRPHRDEWFAEPATSINIWIALGDVQYGNGLSIYPETYLQKIPFQHDVGVIPGQVVGKPVTFKLSAGDALFFHANHLHASELNHTAETRVVLSLRVALERPTTAIHKSKRYTRINPNSVLSTLKLDPRINILERGLHRLRPVFGKYPQKIDSGIPINAPDKMTIVPQQDSIELADLEPGRPTATSATRCLIKLDNGDVFSFNRHCPHQGADMSLGYAEGDNLHCPWHNLPFDLRSGKSPCESLQGIETRRCPVDQGRVILDQET